MFVLYQGIRFFVFSFVRLNFNIVNGESEKERERKKQETLEN
jgi:hypothetical protein